MTVLHTAPGAPRIGRPREHRSLAAVLAAVGIPMFMVTLDNLVVTTVLPVIKTNLGASLTDLQWFVNAYTLSFAAPSKTDAERLLLVSPELSEVLTAIIFRVREGKAGLPLVSAYDVFEPTWSPPMPFLFQRRFGTEDRPLTRSYIRECLVTASQAAQITAADQPLEWHSHDFRRLFVTDAIRSGLPLTSRPRSAVTPLWTQRWDTPLSTPRT